MGNSARASSSTVPSLSVRLFGRLAVTRNGKELSPPSRKVRALLAYLATSQNPVGRTRLCELLGDISNDPRGELRWCLSKLRSLLDEPARAASSPAMTWSDSTSPI